MNNARETGRLAAAADAGTFVATFALIFAAIGGLFAVDTFLAGLERAERRTAAHHLFRAGVTLTRQGRAAEAVDQLGTAVSMERDNPLYQQALAEALFAAGKLTDATTVLSDRLQHDPTDAEASLTMARVLVREKKIPEAMSYYHRAIYGQWRDNPAQHRLQARFELIDLLARQDAKRELLAELLPLQDEAPDDARTRMRIARLFIAAGSPARATEIFRRVLRSDPQNADAYAGLGEAEFARGNYRTAQYHFLTASRLDPDNQQTATQLALCDQVLGLDPIQRGLDPAEMYRRSRRLIELAEEALMSCVGPTPPQPIQAVIDSARSTLTQRMPARRHEAIEADLDLAERLWQVRRARCARPVTTAEEPLALVLEKLRQ